MNSAQQRFLLNRLDEARRTKPSRYAHVKLEEPRAVVEAREAKKRAEKIIEGHGRAVEAATKKRNDAVDRAFNKAKTAVLFQTSEKAIAAIEEFEKTAF